MADLTRKPESDAPPTTEGKTPNKEPSQEVLEWAKSFHHETPPMFRRKFEEAAGSKPSTKGAPKLVDYDSDSDEESTRVKTPTRATVTSATSRPLSIPTSTSHHQETDRPTSVASDPGPDRDVEMEEESSPQALPSVDAAPASQQNPQASGQETSTSKYRLQYAGPVYPTVQQPVLPDLTTVNDPNGIAARRMAKYQSFSANDNFLQTHLHPIAEDHFGPRFHTKFFVKTIGTIMCDQCKQKNNGEMYKCHTCTNQICRACVEERLQREMDERNSPPTHGEEPYEWEWNGKERHEGFKLCYLERKKKANGQGAYSISYVGVVDGQDATEGKIEMIMSDVQGGRKRKDPPVLVGQEKVKLRAIKVEDPDPGLLNRAPSKERERVQQMVFGKDSATLAKLARIQEAANAAAASGKNPARKAAQAGAQQAKGYHRHGNETLAREQQQQLEYDRQMYQAQMLPAVAPEYAMTPQRHIQLPATAPESAYTAGSFEEAQRRGYVAQQWDGTGLPPYEYHPYRDATRQFQGTHHQNSSRDQPRDNRGMLPPIRPGPGMAFTPNGRAQFPTAAPQSWNPYGDPYRMTDAERFQAQMHAQQFQAQAAAIQQMQAQGMPLYAAGAGGRDWGRVPGTFRNPFEVMMAGSPEPAAAAKRAAGVDRCEARPSEPVRDNQGRARQQNAKEAPIEEEQAAAADSIDPSSMLPDDPTIFIPQQHRARPESDHTKWNALINASNVMYQLDLDKLDGMAVGQLTPAQVDAVRQAAKQGQRESREQVAREARERAAIGEMVVIDDDDDEEDVNDNEDQGRRRDTDSEEDVNDNEDQGRRRDTDSEEERSTRNNGKLWQRPDIDVDGGRLRSGKEFTS